MIIFTLTNISELKTRNLPDSFLATDPVKYLLSTPINFSIPFYISHFSLTISKSTFQTPNEAI